MENNNYPKIISALRALEVMKLLIEKPHTVEELIEEIIKIEGIDSIYATETIYKYLNTFRLIGFELKKEKNTYCLLNCCKTINFSKRNLKTLYLIEKYIQSLSQKKLIKEFEEIKRKIFINVSRENYKFYNEINKISDEESSKKIELINSKYSKHKKIIEELEEYCYSKIKIRIKYKDLKNNIFYVSLFPGCLRSHRNLIYLHAFNAEVFEIEKYLVDRILEIQQLNQIKNSLNYTNSITFKITGELCKNYVLKDGETVKEDTPDYKIIYNVLENKEELISRLIRYYDKCEILYPKSAREYMINMIEEIYKNYEE